MLVSNYGNFFVSVRAPYLRREKQCSSFFDEMTFRLKKQQRINLDFFFYCEKNLKER